MVSLHAERFVVVHLGLYSSFSVEWTPEVSFSGKFIPKITIFRDFGGSVHIFKATTVKFGTRVQTWTPSPKPNFVIIA